MIDWHELAKEKPPKEDNYLVRWNENGDIHISDRMWVNSYGGFIGLMVYEDIRWAYLNEPGELTEDDRRLIRLLSRTADMLDDAYLPDDSEQQLAMTLTQDLRAELTARFGPNWEEVLRDKY